MSELPGVVDDIKKQHRLSTDKEALIQLLEECGVASKWRAEKGYKPLAIMLSKVRGKIKQTVE